MKNLLILMSMLFMTQTAFAVDNPGVHQRMFTVLQSIYQNEFGINPCQPGDSQCSIELDHGRCFRYAGCRLTIKNPSQEWQEISIPRTNGYSLSLYIIMRKAHAIKMGDFQRVGPRYRPNFIFNNPLTCQLDLIEQMTECL